jgi:uncharacterized protein (TIGR03437 family)
MNRISAVLATVLGLALLTGAQAATTNTTLTVHATGPLGASGISVTGTASLTGIGSGTFTATLSLATFTAPYTITLTTGTTGTITGTLNAAPLISGGKGSATVTGGTGNFAGATGSFPTLDGTGSLGTTVVVDFSGAGTITTGGGGGTTGPPGPTITAVLDAGSYTSKIAQGSIFVVKGTNMSASGYTAMSFPLPQTSGNVKITFTPAAGGTGTDAYLVYLYNQDNVNQLAAVLPSTVAPGNYNVTVTYNGTASSGFSTQVVARKVGLITADGSGSGLAVIQNFISQSQLDIDRFTTFAAGGYTFSPSKPGQVLIAWAVGMGPVTGGDNTASPGFDFSKTVDVKVIVGGVSITPLYAGRAPGLAGADQINFQLPANVTTGCTVPFQISVAGQLSNSTFIAIAPDGGASACVQPGYTTAQLQQFDNGASRTFGAFTLSQFTISIPQLGTVKQNSAGGGFTKYTGFQLAGLSQAQSQVTSSGACTVTHFTSSGQTAVATGRVGGLDAGAVTLNGPSGSGLTNQAFSQDGDSKQYSLDLGTEGLGLPGGLSVKLVAGQYTITGAGGADVGKFSTSLTLGSPLNLTGGLPATVNRSAGLTLGWTGGNASDLVEIIGSSSTSTGTGASLVTDSYSFICTTTAGAGSFTVPASVLQQLPAAAANSVGGGGYLAFASATAPATFTAPLTAGGNVDNSVFLSFVGNAALVSYQ